MKKYQKLWKMINLDNYCNEYVSSGHGVHNIITYHYSFS